MATGGGLPDLYFKTYLDNKDTRFFNREHYGETHPVSFQPYAMSLEAYKNSKCLDSTWFYDTEQTSRPRSYVLCSIQDGI